MCERSGTQDYQSCRLTAFALLLPISRFHHGSPNVPGNFLTSTHSICAKEPAMLPIRTILHPTDFSANSQCAWEMACALARDYGARLLLVHVEAPMPAFAELGAIPPEPVDRRALECELAKIKPTDS